ncbi:MAG: cell surface protein SprA [Muribaculaceae bacterium]|nr:cell surface protein SprA [Muribaculaceae bacterium]
MKRVVAVMLMCIAATAGTHIPAQEVVEDNDSATRVIPAVKGTSPRNYQELTGKTPAIDLRNPDNVEVVTEYDHERDVYVIHTRIGGRDIALPMILSREEYNRWQAKKMMDAYWQNRNRGLIDGDVAKDPLNPSGILYRHSAIDRLFGPGGLQLTTRGTVQIRTGIKSTKTDNPSLSLQSRRKTYFDFDQRIQASVGARLGERLSFNLNYNTNATFDFDTKNLKLNYEGDEDDIVRSIEAGNVSLTTGSSLIRGSTALFGVKTKLQFGRLTATAIASQQNSSTRSVSSKRGVQTTEFSIRADNYDQNRHFFLAQYFRENYDKFAANLPVVGSGVQITRIEVWVTNKSGNYGQSRNVVAFQDMGENSVLANDYWKPDMSDAVPRNSANNLLSVMQEEYSGARYICQTTQVLAGLAEYGITGGSDYEKVESARLLTEGHDYTVNTTLGYISLNTALRSDEVLGVAFEYTYQGKVYQVGEFSGDVTDSAEALYVKMLRATTISTRFPMWRLMMKNVYSLGGYQMECSNFKLQVKYLSDTTGILINYLPVGSIADKTLLQVMGLDRIDTNGMGNPDGMFDFIDGYTVQPASGRVIFPVAEPFGSHLAKAIGDDALSAPYLYDALYDSTQVVAAQNAERNKFYLTGEYQASSGAEIRLDAVNVPQGSVVVTAGGTELVENVDYTVDYMMGVVTIINQSIIDSGQKIDVSLENQAMFSTQRKTLLGLDMQYEISRNLTVGGTLLHFSEKALTEKVAIGDEIVNNTMAGLNVNWKTQFMWLTNWLNKIPTVNATAPSQLSVNAEFAKLLPHSQKRGSMDGSSYIDDFEESQTGIDLRSPYAWVLASTPSEQGGNALFKEGTLSNNTAYGKNRALICWNHIDRIFTSRNSTLCPSYIKSDLAQLSNPYVREVTSREIFPGRELDYGESSTVQTMNISFYPTERGPYNVDATDIDGDFNLLDPETRWGGIMRRLENTKFEQANIGYLQFWVMSPFLDDENPNTEGGDLYINFGEISEDILKDGMKSYENGIAADGNDEYMTETVWGRVSTQPSLTYSFDNATTSREVQDVGLDGLKNADEFSFATYSDYLSELRMKLPAATVARLEEDKASPFNDPAGDNYHFFLGEDYDQQRLSILERYKRYNGVEGNSLDARLSGEPMYQSARNTPDVEDINQDNTLNEYERYFQYRVSIRPEDFVVGKNYITDKQTSLVLLRDGSTAEAVWYQFKIPLGDYEKVVGGISDFTTIRFMRMFMTGFKNPTHLRFATLELVRGEWRDYDYSLGGNADAPAQGELDVSVVNIEENAGREPVNYVLPPEVSRIVDPGQAQITQLNEQSMSMKVVGLDSSEARAVYRSTQLDLRNYNRLQMWVHAEALIDDATNLGNGELALVLRLGSDVKNNYYEYEIPLTLTRPGKYNNSVPGDREEVWPRENYLDLKLQSLVDLKRERNRARNDNGSDVSYRTIYSKPDGDAEGRLMSVKGNPSLSDVRVMVIGVKNNARMPKSGTVWVNELKVTDFNESGGWGAKVNANLAVSDVATLNFSGHRETAGFGNVDQALNERRMDNYTEYGVTVQTDLGRFLPAAAKISAPVYYSVSEERITPKYNPLDQDVTLRDALDDVTTRAERDSIKAYAVDRGKVTSFSISGLKSNVVSQTPKPWDPGNFTVNFSMNRQSQVNPTTEYENTADYRGSLQYSYTPLRRSVRPFGRISRRGGGWNFLREWEVNYLPANITMQTAMSRYYYEQQARSANDDFFQLPVSVSKNFLWDRRLSLTWNLTQSLSVNFSSNTSARIEETVGAVNKKLFPDRYKEWKDTVWSSILRLGTPWGYNQSFSASYRLPLARIPVLDFVSATGSYSSTYTWDRGTKIGEVETGHSIASRGVWTGEGRLNLEGMYNKSGYLRELNQRYWGNARRGSSRRQLRRMERSVTLVPDSVVLLKHGLRSKRVKVNAIDASGKAVQLRIRPTDRNNMEIALRGSGVTDTARRIVTVTVTEVRDDERTVLRKIADYSVRALMSVRNISLQYKRNNTLSMPLFNNEIGNFFGQSGKYGPLSPGLDFAFGFAGEDFIARSKERGWLITDNGQTIPAMFSIGNEVHTEIQLEPVKGLKITLTGNRTDNRTKQVQFMYADMPVMRGGSFTMTTVALSSALRTSSADNGYYSSAFERFTDNVEVVAERVRSRYRGVTYPTGGFLEGTVYAGQSFSEDVGDVQQTSGDVLIPAFIAAYTGRDAGGVPLAPFPSVGAMLPNWRVSYDGLINYFGLRDRFKSIVFNHAYQCAYTIGSYSSYPGWMGADATDANIGFRMQEQTGRPVPSSPFNITSVAIAERFAPLIGASVTLKNDITLSAEYRDQRTLTLNTSAAQVVEATTRGLVIGAGYKIVGFNTFLKMKGRQSGVSNDLSLNADFSIQNTQALIRRIEGAYTQATSGTRTMVLNFSANYVLSKRFTIGAYVDHQVNTPIVTAYAYPTVNTSYGLLFNLSLAR